ncbi:hypothetical protein GCM10011497_32910 [Elstera cyanobacteriorum]|uniref:ATPase AAA-type core domain-containing protein n=1 Tax=Elstera cyanobacteriorum TaxID=2022747 RepID=A0A255XUF0_9PROT|nr:AAA family ATPase [Elstera cyanobacteriorum]OYQ20598.1 hypothetical protein CHR90_04280 [Elstera cyanobacteriorum]GFZ99614.1 hypothetical protein GCM10011497_32910 [Elstera cyanobacteriorum]
MITKLYVDNYKTLVDFTVEFEPLTLIVGGNGTGKSAITEILNALSLLARGKAELRSFFPKETLSKSINKKQQQAIGVFFDIDNDKYEYRLELHHKLSGDGFSRIREILIVNGEVFFERNDDTIKHIDKNRDAVIAGMARLEEKLALYYIMGFTPEDKTARVFETMATRINTHQINPFSVNGFSIEESRFLNRQGDNFSAWYRHYAAENPLILPGLFSEIADFMPGFTQFRLSGEEGRRALMCDFSNGASIDFDYLSEGQKCLILLYSLLNFNAAKDVLRKVLVFDEPENFISLKEIQPWLRKVEDWVEEGNGQIILISHHPETMNYEGDDSLVWLERENGGPTRLKSREDIAAGYGLLLSDRFSREA